ncbi:MAG: hypothetical protein Q8L14_17285 [Myxococcales bacterium]|nr:hypothetical protein [Myxococcales bacterium]
MAWWLTVYCRKPISGLTPEQLTAGITGRDPEAGAGDDYLTLAEGYDVDEALVKPALRALAISKDLELSYGEARPVVMHVWSSADRVAEELHEMHEVRAPPVSLHARLAETKEIVGLELGFSQLESMGIVLAFELARYLAQKGDGVLVDDDDRWQRVVDGAFEDIDE